MLLDGVGEGADVLDGDGDGVAGFEVADAGWGAAVDEVAWHEGGEFAEVGDESGDGEDHLSGVAVLAWFAVEEGLYAEVLWVLDVGFNPWAEGFVVGLGFGAEPLFVGVLVGAVADVVAAGVAQYVVEGVFLGDAAAAATDDGDEFGFVVDGVVGLGEGNGGVWAGDGGGGAEEGDWCVGVGAGWVDVFEFVNVGGVVEADGVDVGWVDGCEEFAVCEGDGGVGEVDVRAKDVAVYEGGGLVVVDACVVDLLVEFDACEFHGWVLLSWVFVGFIIHYGGGYYIEGICFMGWGLVVVRWLWGSLGLRASFPLPPLPRFPFPQRGTAHLGLLLRSR